METGKIWAVIPAHNEEKNIAAIVKSTGKHVSRIVVVDDGSKDRTGALAGKSGAFVLTHIVNLGKGAALKTGCDYAIKNGAQVIVALDADAQHNPKDIPRFIKALKHRSVVFGYRRLNKDMPSVLLFGNWFISAMARLLYGTDLKDTQCGFRAFTREAYMKIRWNSSDYSMESEMISKVGRHKLGYAQIPIETVYQNKYKGTTVIDGIKIVLNMVWWKLFNSR